MSVTRTAWPARLKLFRVRDRSWLAGLGALVFLLSAVLGHAAPVASETEAKAAILYNFTKFVQWPAEAFSSTNAPIQFAVVGDEQFAAELKTRLHDKKAHGRLFEVKTITNPQEAKNFHIVFVAGSENRRTFQVLEAVKKNPTLTIGESEQFLGLGGMIDLFFEDGQPGFNVNPEPAEKVKLEISSKLLRLVKKRRDK